MINIKKALKKVELMDSFTGEYYLPDIVNYVLHQEQDGNNVTADQLTSDQKDALIVVLYNGYIDQLRRMRKIRTLCLYE